MKKYCITKENLVAVLPPSLQKDPSAVALAESMAEVLSRRPAEIDLLRIYPEIDRLDEQLLDILAYDFKVDWWDSDYLLDEKRRTLKDSWKVHKLLGTRAAVETAIRAIYPETTVEPWWEYGGEPYHFQLHINITGDSGDRKRQKRVLERLDYYKSLRDTVDAVKYFLMPEKSWAVAGALCAGCREADRAVIRVPELAKPGGKNAVLAGGGLMGARQRIDGSADAPPLARPQGAARRAASAGCFGSIERVTVRPDAGRVQAPGGRAATAGAAGIFHSYQRIGVHIPATISGR